MLAELCSSPGRDVEGVLRQKQDKPYVYRIVDGGSPKIKVI